MGVNKNNPIWSNILGKNKWSVWVCMNIIHYWQTIGNEFCLQNSVSISVVLFWVVYFGYGSNSIILLWYLFVFMCIFVQYNHILDKKTKKKKHIIVIFSWYLLVFMHIYCNILKFDKKIKKKTSIILSYFHIKWTNEKRNHFRWTNKNGQFGYGCKSK